MGAARIIDESFFGWIVDGLIACGGRATHNARIVNGIQVYDGDLVAVGDTEAANEDTPVITYDLRCRRHWLEGLHRQMQEPLFEDQLLDDLVIEL